MKIWKMVSQTPTLLGPPELYKPLRSAKPSSASRSADPFMDLLLENFNKVDLPRGFTENRSPTFLSSGNPCLDFFFHVVPDTPPDSVARRLELAWAHHPLTSLKLVSNLRGVRGTGKSDRECFYAAALWLHRRHPRTLARNVGAFAEFGYFKDLPEILYRLLEGPDVRRVQKAEWLQRKGRRSRRRFEKVLKGPRKGKRLAVPKHIRVRRANERSKDEAEKARVLKEERRLAMAKKVVERYRFDSDFRFLYERISDHFAECLLADLGFLEANEPAKISFAAKWCPSLDSSFDRSTLLCESIARKVFPRESCPEYEGVDEAHYAYRVRDRLRKQILVPLRKALELPEVYMGANRWSEIPYNKVPSVAMKLYKSKFLKHDRTRFREYLSEVSEGKATIAAGALLPHEIIASLNGYDGEAEVAELQWKRMVDDLLKVGKMRNCLAVSDVSGSMSGTPMDVSVAMGVLVSELSEEPWRGKIVTFSERPQLHVIEGDNLESKMEFVRTMEWGMNTDFQRVFDLILRVAESGGLKAEQMVKRVFVFSDMEFDQASANAWESDYEAIVRKFGEKGFGGAVPEMVFWNLRESMAVPVPGRQRGVALVSGFSKNLMKLFLDSCGEMNPEAIMEAAISGEEYQRLVVVD